MVRLEPLLDQLGALFNGSVNRVATRDIDEDIFDNISDCKVGKDESRSKDQSLRHDA
jgi:hypothetical protein